MKNALEVLNARYAGALGEGRRLVVGEGCACAALMLVGEAPGGQEEAQGRPFVGQAGKNLDAFLKEVGFSRDALYITNAVKFRPTKPGKSGKPINRTPTGREVEAFRPWLLAEIEAVSPRVIATLGNTALHAVLADAPAIGQVHGMALEGPSGSAVFPLYHPASVLYRRELASTYAEDLAKLRSYLGPDQAIFAFSSELFCRLKTSNATRPGHGRI